MEDPESPNLTLEEKIKLTDLTEDKERNALRNKVILKIMSGCSSDVSTHCMEWEGHKTKAGYGVVTHDGGQKYTHRTIFMEWHGITLTSDEYVCHRCDNRRCANIAHLFLGTHLENVRDMYRKGRDAFSQGRSNIPTGDKCRISKITEAQEMEIRDLFKQGLSNAEIFKTGKFPITVSLIWRIRHGKTRRRNFTPPTNS